MLRLIRWTAAGLAVMLALAWGVVWMAQADPAGRAALLVNGVSRGNRAAGPVMETGAGGSFDLIDSAGHAVTDQMFRGKWMLIYFGYSYCPDICPTTLQTISNVLDLLGDKAPQIAPIFITVDPERDTPAAIGQYVALFDQRLIGLTGSPAQVASAKASFRVYTRRMNSAGSLADGVDHSSYIYLEGPDGKLKALFQDGMIESDMVIAITIAMVGRVDSARHDG